MKAISIRAPWWWFILKVGKDIENRDWHTNYRGTVLIHASKWWKVGEVEDDWDYGMTCAEMQFNKILGEVAFKEPEVERETLRKIRSFGGCIVGKVDIVDCVKESKSPWFCGDYGFVLRNPVPFAKPYPVKGALGFFDAPTPETATVG